jgi:hypothetical protein
MTLDKNDKNAAQMSSIDLSYFSGTGNTFLVVKRIK